ncbi:MAG: FAD-dependent thymidylate synthase, partial [Bacteroidales bacterium]|nr:FAD-dependent thymidylate synthase [Bacteroidales bacterium]
HKCFLVLSKWGNFMESKLKVILLRHTPEPEKAIASAARLCYSPSDVEKLMEKMDEESSSKLLKKLVDLGHESPLEHVSFTFAIEGVSRTLTHQLVRHRMASYSHQSQRYVKAEDFDYIIPPSIKKDEKSKVKYEEIMKTISNAYSELLQVVEKEDARFILPNAAETKIIVTMNARGLKNFFKLRCCTRAQWEIRNLANKMLKICKEVSPVLFNRMGPDCVAEKICNEGYMSCGMWKNIEGARLK